MKRLLLVSSTTGYQVQAFREAAGRAGIALALASDRCHVLEDPWRDGAIPVRFEQPQESVEQIVAFAREHPIAGVVATGDSPALAAALAARALGVDFHPPEAAEACRNKFLARERYRAAGLPVPWYRRIPIACDPREAAAVAPFPCVLKPLGLSASRGVIRANNPTEFVAALERIRALLVAPDIQHLLGEAACFIQIEGYIPGCELAIEGIVTRGRLRVLAIFDKPDPLEGPYFEETIYVTPSRLGLAEQSTIVETVERAVHAVGLWHGPLHAEVRLNDARLNADGVWMLEMAARPIGGLCAGALRFGPNGMPLEELILRHAAGEPVEDLDREPSASGVMMIPIPHGGIFERVENLEGAERVPGIERIEITAKQGQKLLLLPEGSSYLGFIFARGERPEFVEAALRRAHRELHIILSPLLPVI